MRAGSNEWLATRTRTLTREQALANEWPAAILPDDVVDEVRREGGSRFARYQYV